MPSLNTHIIPHLTGIILYLVLLVVIIRQRGIRDRVARWLSAFLGVSLIFEIANLTENTKPFQITSAIFLANLDLYANLIRALFLLHLSVLFFRRKTDWFWWSLGGIILIIMIILDIARFSGPFIITIGSSRIIDGLTILKAGLIAGWGLMMARILWRTLRAYRKGEFIITRPRILLWSFGLILIIVGDLLIILQFVLNGIAFQISGAVSVSYIVLTTQLPDIKGVFQRLTYVFLSTVLELMIYTLGFILIFAFIGENFGYQPAVISLGLGLILLLLLNPFLRILKKSLQKLFFGEERDERLILRDFSKNISSVLDSNLLSSVIIEKIGDWIPVTHGTLFTVDTEVGDNIERRYRLVNIQRNVTEIRPPGLLPVDSPIAISFWRERKSIKMVDMETLPEYQSAGTDEFNWFRSQKSVLFVPIFGMDEWIGLLALGQKVSGSSFTSTDIHLLETISDQIAVGLQNARLVESLVRVNNEFRRAYTAMEDAHAKLERLDHTKSDFINITSHELRTPLTVISGYSQMLLEDPIYKENDFYQKVIDGIHEGTIRLHEIVAAMLDVAKIDTRALELQKEPTNMKELLHGVYAQFRKAINERSLVLSFEKLDDLPLISGDPKALEKVFYHLISNAIKFTPDGGKISIAGSVIPKGDTKFQAGGVQIVISDTGIGIDPRFKELIFSKFYQTGELVLHSSGRTKFKGGGPGLGLAIVRGIVQAHGGRVWAESPGYDEEKLPGSLFSVVLPVDLGD